MKRNEMENSAAKLALDLSKDKFKIPFNELKSKINNFLRTKWEKL